MGRGQTPPPPLQGEETWRAGSPSSRGRGDRDRGATPRTRRSFGRPSQGPSPGVAHLAGCPGARRRRRRRHRPQVKLPRAPRPDAARLCVPARPLPSQWAWAVCSVIPPRTVAATVAAAAAAVAAARGILEAPKATRPRAPPSLETPRARVDPWRPSSAPLPGRKSRYGADSAPAATGTTPWRRTPGAAPSLPRPPAPPGTGAPSAPAARLLHLPLGGGQGASARPPASGGASRLRRCTRRPAPPAGTVSGAASKTASEAPLGVASSLWKSTLCTRPREDPDRRGPRGRERGTQAPGLCPLGRSSERSVNSECHTLPCVLETATAAWTQWAFQ